MRAHPRAAAWQRLAGPHRPTPVWLVLEAKEAKANPSSYAKTADHALTRQPDGSYLFTRLNGAYVLVDGP